MPQRMGRMVAMGMGALLLLAGTAMPANAQYFGRNKVQYESFDFQVLRTEHFDIYHYPEEREIVELVAPMAERWYARLARYFNHELSGRQPLILYATQSQFQQTNAIGGDIGEGTGGVTEALLRRIVMPIGGPLQETDHVLGHELVHAFQYDVTGAPGMRTQGLPGVSRLPLWFVEGMAEYLSLGPRYPHTAMWLRDAATRDLPDLRDLYDPRFFPYRYGHALLAFVGGRFGDEAVAALLRSAGRTGSVELAIQQVLRLPPERLVELWHEATKEAYLPLLEVTSVADSAAALVIAPDAEKHRYNVSPALSPDGTRMVFLSDRSLFSIDLFLADARTGEIIDRLTSTDLDPHLQSLQFLNSSGAWAADNRRLVFTGLSGGRPVLLIYDADEGDVVREIKLDRLGDIFSPTWSPDGRQIAFSATVGAASDLYVYDLEADSLSQLTDDAFADLQPDWSPDGRTIALATDRFATTLSPVVPGDYSLALLDVASGRVRPLTEDVDGKQIMPQWGPGGDWLYFVSNHTGIPNVYRIAPAGGGLEPITNLYGGVSGITDLSPALAVASGSGAIVFSAFKEDGYGLYRIEQPVPVQGAPQTAVADARPGMLPPQDRVADGVMALVQNNEIGLPPAGAEFAVDAYRPGLKLVYVGQPTVSAGADQFGTYVGGGVALYFSDLLGNRNVVTALSVNGGLKDITAVAAYQNLRGRLGWGVTAQQVPYLTGGYSVFGATVNGQPVLVEERLLIRQTNRQVGGQLYYPFSTVQRVELGGAFRNISFDRELRTRLYDPSGSVLLDEIDEDLDAQDALNLGEGSLALVYDNSYFGATSPILGQRYRLEVSPMLGSLSMVNALVDWRRYFMPVRPFTLAFRAMHYGRYGGDSEDPRLNPLFIGYEGLVRGYRVGSFSAAECEPVAGDPNACPVFDQLIGSRVLIGNAELRFPLLGVLGIGSGYYGALPIELAVFGDAGVAWTAEDEPQFAGGTRDIVSSAGVAARLNLLGFLIAEVSYVRPFQRPDKGWMWQFALQPGF